MKYSSISRRIAGRGKRDSNPDEKISSESIFRGVNEAKKKLHDRFVFNYFVSLFLLTISYYFSSFHDNCLIQNNLKIVLSGTNASGSMQEKMDKIKMQIEKSKVQQKQNEENMKKYLESDEGMNNIAFGQGEIIKILVPILVIIIALQLFTGANDA